MKQGQKQGWTRLTALVLALTLLLAGCGAPAGEAGAPEDAPSTEDPSEAAGNEETEGTGTEEESALDGGEEPALDMGTGNDAPLSDEEAALLARTGALEGESVEISEEEAVEINQSVANMWAAYVAGPNGEDPLVEPRDWSVYTSPLGAENLSRREAEFYKRLDKMCLKYLSTSGLDGVKVSNSRNEHTRYKIGGVSYSDLGLSADQAQDILSWFTYNNPQYYFLNCWGAWTWDTVYPCIYEFAADGEERAKITNELFDKLDGWIETVESSASSTYQKELYANNLICETVTYNHDALEDRNGAEMWLCQSLYSAVMLEDTVCAGYSKTFCAMMSAMGVDATAGLSSNHAWNVVRFDDGNYYAVDVCWNDTDGNPAYRNNYLNIGEEIMSATNSRKEAHTYKEKYAGWIPAIAKESYVLTNEDTPLAAPTNIQATPVEGDDTKVVVTWNAVPGAAGYEVILYRDASYQEVWNQASLAAGECSVRLINLKQDETRYLAIRTIAGAGGQETYSDWTEFSYTHGRLAAPGNAAATATGEDEVMISWDPVPGAVVYDSCAFTDSTRTEIMEGCLYTEPADGGETFYWTGLVAGETYYFGVRAGKDVNGETVYSDWVNLSYTHTAP